MNICRTCLVETLDLLPLFELDKQLPMKIKELASIHVSESDGFPPTICEPCIVKIHDFHEFRQQIQASERFLRNKFTLLDPKMNLISTNNNERTRVNRNRQKNKLISNNCNVKTCNLPETKSNEINPNIEISKISSAKQLENLNTTVLKSSSKRSENTNKDNVINKNSRNVGKNNRKSDKFEDVIVKIEESKKEIPNIQNLKHTLSSLGNFAVETSNCEEVLDEIKQELQENDTKMCLGEEENEALQLKNQNASKPRKIKYKLKIEKNAQISRSLKPYKCPMCQFTTFHRHKFNFHKTKHNPKPREPCTICSKPVKTENMKLHILTHSVDNPITCDICGRIFKNMQSYRSHPQMHIKEDSICEVCGKTFQYKGEYIRHMRVHREKVRKHQCTLCEKCFSDKKTLEKHINSHTGLRPFPCDICKKNFSSSYALKTHTRQHTNERPYVCGVCSAAFPQRVSLRTHMKSKHNIDLPKLQ